MARVKVQFEQCATRVGDISGNVALMLERARSAATSGADIVVFPELAVIGYPPEDLLFRQDLKKRIDWALEALMVANVPVDLVVGFPQVVGQGRYNCVGVIRAGQMIAVYRKQCLPNYEVFDEKRYFLPGDETVVFLCNGVPVALSICEDLWEPWPMDRVRQAGAQLLLNVNASPYHMGKPQSRRKLVAERARQGQCAIAYVNCVGGQDELVFDGRSLAVDAQGQICYEGPSCLEASALLEFDSEKRGWLPCPATDDALVPKSLEAELYQVLVTGVRDYVNHNGFPSAVLGLSGGIDSALTLCLAVDALGAERVHAVMMPYHYTATESIELARQQALLMGVRFSIKPIESIVAALMASLGDVLDGAQTGVAQQNLQARARGVLLMAMSNQAGSIVLTTGNKSELAVGYSTLYGDMAGGFDAIKDVPKTLVYRLARFCNSTGLRIPERVIDRPPTAELAPGQKDEDTLPPYTILDQILNLYVDQEQSFAQIKEAGFEPDVVTRVIAMVDRNEYKRRQAPMGVRVTQKAFGKDRRYPVTTRWSVEDQAHLRRQGDS